MSGYVTYEAVDLVMKHLNLKDYQARDLLIKGSGNGAINVNKLPLYFKELPSAASDSDVEAHAKAFIMYLLGTTLLPNRKGTIMPDFLELLDLQKINKYAWGAAVLAHIKNALGNDKKSICCFTWGLIVSFLDCHFNLYESYYFITLVLYFFLIGICIRAVPLHKERICFTTYTTPVFDLDRCGVHKLQKQTHKNKSGRLH